MFKKSFIVFLFLTFGIVFSGFAQQLLPVQLVQKQLDAYNQRDIEAFLEPYSDTVKVFNFPNELVFEGKTKMRKSYKKMFENTPDLHCTLINRTSLKNTVIDKEYVIFDKKNPALEVIAVYKIKNEKIVEVYFIRG